MIEQIAEGVLLITSGVVFFVAGCLYLRAYQSKCGGCSSKSCQSGGSCGVQPVVVQRK